MQFLNYDTIIFDCDGVIFDSNELKIEAMKSALTSIFIDNEKVDLCAQYFRLNFGKSRFHHVDYFLDKIFSISNLSEKDFYHEKIICSYSKFCRELYLKAELVDGFLNLLYLLKDKKLYVASGSEEKELKQILTARQLINYFDDVYGSPMSKEENIKTILNSSFENSKAVMVGDAISDYKAAKMNGIDFVFFRPFSNVKEELSEICKHDGSLILDKF